MPNALETLLPPAVLARPRDAAAQLPRALMTRANFIPGVRHRLGWRGMRDCSCGSGGVTVRVTDRPGVYGLEPAGSCEQDGTGLALFHVYYFPARDEELMDAFSIQAGLIVLADDYLDRVRDFSLHAPLRALFRIGTLETSCTPARSGLSLGLVAPQRDIILALDGVQVRTPDGPVQAVLPGAPDQDLSAWATAMPLFQALAASATYCLGKAPDTLERLVRAGTRRVYSDDSALLREPYAEVQDFHLCLGYGCEPPRPAGFEKTDLYWTAPQPLPGEYADAPWWTPDVPGASNSLDKRTMGITDKPRLIVLTGFLGAGKTSFLMRFIENQAAKGGFVAVVQNEIGQKGLDGKLLGQHFAVTEVDEGCVCCTLAGSLRLALTEILSQFQPDFVVLETTGLANPANLLQEIADLNDMLDFASVTTVLDAANAPKALADHEVARSQVRVADVLLLNKTDLAGPSEQEELCALVRALNPTAPMHRTSHGDIPPAVLYGVNFRQQAARPAPHLPTLKQAATHQEDHISSAHISLDVPVDRVLFERHAATFPPGVLRVKGVVEFCGGDGPEIFQYVPGSYRFTPADPALADRFLILIGHDAEQAAAEFRRSILP